MPLWRKLFRLRLDDAQGAAVRICAACALTLHRRQRRVSGRGRAGRLRLRVWGDQFEITVGVAVY